MFNPFKLNMTSMPKYFQFHRNCSNVAIVLVTEVLLENQQLKKQMLFHSHILWLILQQIFETERLCFANNLSPVPRLELDGIGMNSTNYMAGKGLMNSNNLQATQTGPRNLPWALRFPCPETSHRCAYFRCVSQPLVHTVAENIH